jgi:hypothetical protein
MRSLLLRTAFVFLALLSGCGGAPASATRDSAVGPQTTASRAGTVPVVVEVHDSALRRRLDSLPVDTAPNLGAGGGVSTIRQVPRAPVTPECAPAGPALCIADVAREWPRDTDGYSSPHSAWVITAAAGDSLEFHAKPGDRRAESLLLSLGSRALGSQRFWQENLPGLTAPFLRMRFPATGAYVLEASVDGMDADTGVAYQLRVLAASASPRTRPSGRVARLVLRAEEETEIALVPAWADTLHADVRAWAVPPGDYLVLLGADSVYRACRLPCHASNAVVLRAGRQVDLRF